MLTIELPMTVKKRINWKYNHTKFTWKAENKQTNIDRKDFIWQPRIVLVLSAYSVDIQNNP